MGADLFHPWPSSWLLIDTDNVCNDHNQWCMHYIGKSYRKEDTNDLYGACIGSRGEAVVV